MIQEFGTSMVEEEGKKYSQLPYLVQEITHRVSLLFIKDTVSLL